MRDICTQKSNQTQNVTHFRKTNHLPRLKERKSIFSVDSSNRAPHEHSRLRLLGGNILLFHASAGTTTYWFGAKGAELKALVIGFHVIDASTP